MPLGEGNLALHHALELAAVGEPGEMVGPRFIGELTRPIDCDCDLVGDRRHEQQIAGAEQSINDRSDRHHADRPTSDAKLCAQCIPFQARDAIDLGFRPPDGRGGRFHVWSDLAGEVIELILVEADRVYELV